MASENLREFTDENFQAEVLDNGAMATLVDFWAPWCGPCRMVGPIIEELSDDYAGKIQVGKVNVDDSPELAQKYKVMTIPTVAVFKNGVMVDKLIGARVKEDFEEMVDKAL